VKAAIRWTRANADRLGFDASRLAVLGYSAGALLSLVAAGSQNEPQLEGDGGLADVKTDVGACVAFYPPSGASGHAVLGPDPTEELRRSYNTLEYMQPGYPPTILFHGTADTMVSVDDSLEIFARLRSIGAAVELHLVEGVTHIFDSHADLAQASATWIDLFLDRHVVNPRVYPSTEPPR
jgi:acetyl esterase/lipase